MTSIKSYMKCDGLACGGEEGGGEEGGLRGEGGTTLASYPGPSFDFAHGVRVPGM